MITSTIGVVMDVRTKGYLYTISAVTLFAAQDAVTRYLGAIYPTVFITLIRFIAFAIFVTVLAVYSPGGLKQTVKTAHPWLQVSRGILLVAEVIVLVYSFSITGLAMSQSIFQATPLIVTVLAVPLLGESVGIRQLIAVTIGLCGVVIILNPTDVHFDWSSGLPLLAALMFALYSIATRLVGRKDSPITSLFYTGVVGLIAISLIGPFYWTSVRTYDWFALAALCVFGTLSHYLLISAYRLLPASEVQPVTYFQLVLSVLFAVVFFDETLTGRMIFGAILVVGAGIWVISHRADKFGQPASARRHQKG